MVGRSSIASNRECAGKDRNVNANYYYYINSLEIV